MDSEFTILKRTGFVHLSVGYRKVIGRQVSSGT